MGWFDVIGAGDIVPAKKPAPDIYHYVLKEMNFCERPQSDDMTPNIANGIEDSGMLGLYQAQVTPSASNQPVITPTSPPLPGILKARVKHEH